MLIIFNVQNYNSPTFYGHKNLGNAILLYPIYTVIEVAVLMNINRHR